MSEHVFQAIQIATVSDSGSYTAWNDEKQAIGERGRLAGLGMDVRVCIREVTTRITTGEWAGIDA